MLDLTQLTTKTFDIKIDENTILNIRKPSNELFKDTFKMIKLIEANGEEDKLIGVLYNFLTKVFNRNLNDKKFTQQEMEDLFDIDIAIYLIQEYWKFIEEVMQDISF